jgi:uncharacterized protein (UPF0335 family)
MELSAGNVEVFISPPNSGHTPEQLAAMCADRLMHVSENVHPAIRDQAREFKDHIRVVVEEYIKKAVKADRRTVYNALKSTGHDELAKMVMEL